MPETPLIHADLSVSGGAGSGADHSTDSINKPGLFDACSSSFTSLCWAFLCVVDSSSCVVSSVTFDYAVRVPLALLQLDHITSGKRSMGAPQNTRTLHNTPPLVRLNGLVGLAHALDVRTAALRRAGLVARFGS